MSVRILVGDALEQLRMLPAESAQLCLTSPPYAFLRSYLPADHPDKAREMGSEPTPDAYVAVLVEVFREVRRVLRHDGVLVLNLGDSMAGSGKGPTGKNGIGNQERRQGFVGSGARAYDTSEPLPPKNLLMIPFRVALALQADGWILRSVMPWVKRNSMPESVVDRPASAIEYLFLLARSERYFWDAEAIRQAYPESSLKRFESSPIQDVRSGSTKGMRQGGEFGLRDSPKRDDLKANPAGRSYRNSDPFFATWQGLMLDEDGDPLALVVNPQPSRLQHYASYPPSLVEPFVKAGTSERGACPACGAPSCSCDAGEPRPCVVLDPFLGSGTTCLVAERLGRDSIGIELNETYARMAERRISDECPMFTSVEVG